MDNTELVMGGLGALGALYAGFMKFRPPKKDGAALEALIRRFDVLETKQQFQTTAIEALQHDLSLTDGRVDGLQQQAAVVAALGERIERELNGLRTDLNAKLVDHGRVLEAIDNLKRK